MSSNNVSPNALARVHGHDHTRPLPPPRLPETLGTTTLPLTAPLTPLSTSSSFRTTSRTPLTGTTSLSDSNSLSRTLAEVTLTVPRPDGERMINEYVETPFRQPTSTPTSQKCLKNDRRHQNHHHHQLQAQQNKSTDGRTHSRRHQSHLLQSSTLPVMKQPISFTKEPSSPLGSSSLAVGIRPNDTSLSIMCDYCGRCRCESCREPPPLPSRWLCDNSCFCSAETALDYASCLCCVKGLFYHCADSGSGGGDSEAGASCADEPCSCSGTRKTARWACLAALTVFLPCLLCYWPLKGCVAVCEACYARHAAQGCRCDPSSVDRHQQASLAGARDSRDPEKRLLDPVTPEL